MSDDTNSSRASPPQEEIESFFEEMSQSYMSAVEDTIEAQAALFEQWTDTMEESIDPDEIQDGYEGMIDAYEVWMDAAEHSLEEMTEAMDGNEVDPRQFRNIWLNAANDAFKEVMSTTAFAAAAGETTDTALDLRQEFDEAAMDTLETYGFATRRDVREVGERLVELERRQHDLEKKLDRVLAAVE